MKRLVLLILLVASCHQTRIYHGIPLDFKPACSGDTCVAGGKAYLCIQSAVHEGCDETITYECAPLNVPLSSPAERTGP